MGNIKPFETFFKTNYHGLVKKAFILIQNQYVAEDIVQETFLYFWNNHKKISITDSLLQYLSQSVKNASINYLKSAYVRKQTSELDLEKFNHFSDPSTMKAAEDLKKEIREAIRNLPPGCRTIFLLSRFTEFTYKEIAEKLGISVKTVENQMTIALSRLRKSLEHHTFQLMLIFQKRKY